jgi:NCAIR mutase (PurE)-related protein
VDGAARVVLVGEVPEPVGEVLVLSAGTSDGPVAAEVAATLAALGVGARRVDDVGVAGVHRVLAVRSELAAADAVVVVAGMDGALPGVVAGLTDRLVIAVPTSVGYGAAFDGLAPLLTMLTACAPGVVVVNIDNGFGAAVAAATVVRSTRR